MKSHKVIFLRSQLPKTDSRLQRYVSILKEEKIDYLIVGWDRNNSNEIANKEILYKKKTPIGGGLKNIFSLFLWNVFLFKVLWKKRRSYTKIHAVDFDTAIPAYLMSKLLRKEYILDIYDKYTDARNMPVFFSVIIDLIEYFCCIKATKLILPDVCRVKQLKLEKKIIPLVIENVPIVPTFRKRTEKTYFPPIVFSYVGILESKNRGLENLLDVISKYPNNTKLLIAGDGELREYIEQATKNNCNIVFFGSVSQQKALEIMDESHIVVGMYYKTVKNHRYASPNKYYEHLFLEKALLTTEGTPPGDKVLAHNTGYVIGESKKDIENVIKNFSISQWTSFVQNAGEIWSDRYANYRNRMKQEYISALM
ncbi:glycosyltransferase [Capnocytophaga canis]|uniref:glycosyltransferase n=1 Tax=Capnocytophaga canis TaxID=1848903 RepID=UPI00370D148A